MQLYAYLFYLLIKMRHRLTEMDKIRIIQGYESRRTCEISRELGLNR